MPDFGDSLTPDGTTGTGRYQYEGQADPNEPSVANGQISPEQWEAYRRKRKRDAILGILSVLGGTTALGALGGALGGGGAAAAGGLGAIEGGAPWAVTPYVGTAAMNAPGAIGAGVGAGVGAGAGAVGGAANTVAGGGGAASGLLGMGGNDLAALIAALTGTVGGALTNRPNTEPTTATMDPSLRGLLDMQTSRLKKQEPLYDSIMAMANGLLPTQYQKGSTPGGL